MSKCLPNFLIVGAAKSGTSSLHNFLRKHHDVFMPNYIHNVKVKEPRFFVKNSIEGRINNYVDNFEDYKKLFSKSCGKSAVGEASVFYLYFFEEAIRNIKKYLGNDIKIIILLRNPVERALSAYNHVSRTKLENLSFEEAINIEDYRFKNNKNITPMINYKNMGLYYKMVKAYIESFKDVKIILFEDFINNTNKSVNDCFDFLKIKNMKILKEEKVNVGGRKWSNNFYKTIYNEKKHYLTFLKKVLPLNIRTKLNEWFYNEFTLENKRMKKQTKEYLINFFKEDIKSLSLLINKDLNHWLK